MQGERTTAAVAGRARRQEREAEERTAAERAQKKRAKKARRQQAEAAGRCLCILQGRAPTPGAKQCLILAAKHCFFCGCYSLKHLTMGLW